MKWLYIKHELPVYFDKQQFQLLFVTQYVALEEKDSVTVELCYKCKEKVKY